MRSYLILKEKVARFRADDEIQGLINALKQQDSEYSGPAANIGYSHAGPVRPSSRTRLTWMR